MEGLVFYCCLFASKYISILFLHLVEEKNVLFSFSSHTVFLACFFQVIFSPLILFPGVILDNALGPLARILFPGHSILGFFDVFLVGTCCLGVYKLLMEIPKLTSFKRNQVIYVLVSTSPSNCWQASFILLKIFRATSFHRQFYSLRMIALIVA